MADGANDDPDDFRRVYRAVAAGESVENVRRLIEASAQGSDERRAAAANKAGEHEEGPETPLQAAHRLRRGDLVGVLLEAGCDVDVQLNSRCKSALALCIAYGQADCLRALLRSGRADANAPIVLRDGAYRTASDSDPEYYKRAAVHVCMQPPWLGTGVFSPPPQLACLEVLVREGGADINARDGRGLTPLHWLCSRHRDRVTALERSNGVDFLVRLGADVNAQDERGATPVFHLASYGDLPTLHRLLAHGASVNVADNEGETPLMRACWHSSYDTVPNNEPLYEVLRLSSEQTRRAVRPHAGRSAVDLVIQGRLGAPLQPPHKQLIAELLAYGVPVLPHNAPLVLPIAVSVATRQQSALAAHQSSLCSWRAHEAAVGLALDARDAREAEEEVEAARRRVEALEEELQGGAGVESETDGEEEEDDEGDEQ